MAITATRGLATYDETNGGTITVPYQVKEQDPALELRILDARTAAINQAIIDIGIAPSAAPGRETGDRTASFELTFNRYEFEEVFSFKQANPPGSIYTPKILDIRSARVLPPGPRKLEMAYAIVQKHPSDLPDSLTMAVDKDQNPKEAEIYPPSETLFRKALVPASLLTDDYIEQLAAYAHHLNSQPLKIGTKRFDPGTIMLLTASLEDSGGGFGLVRYGFAAGRPYSYTWTRTPPGGGATSSVTTTGIKPYSRLTFNQTSVAGTAGSPARTQLHGLLEHRVWPQIDFSPVLPPFTL